MELTLTITISVLTWLISSLLFYRTLVFFFSSRREKTSLLNKNNDIENWWSSNKKYKTIDVINLTAINTLNYYKKNIKDNRFAKSKTLFLSLLFTSTAYFLGNFMYIIVSISALVANSNSEADLTVVFDLFKNLVYTIFYFLLFYAFYKDLYTKINQSKLTFNWLFRCYYFIFLANLVLLPFLERILSVDIDGVQFNLRAILLGSVSIVVLEILLWKNRNYNWKRFLSIFIPLVFIMLIAKFGFQLNLGFIVYDVYFGLNVWSINFVFDFITLSIFIFFLEKIQVSNSIWKAIILMITCIIASYILAYSLFYFLPFLDNLVKYAIDPNGPISYNKNLKLIQQMVDSNLVKNRYLHHLYSGTTFIPIGCFFVVLLIKYLWKKAIKTTSHILENSYLKLPKSLVGNPVELYLFIFAYSLNFLLHALTTLLILTSSK